MAREMCLHARTLVRSPQTEQWRRMVERASSSVLLFHKQRSPIKLFYPTLFDVVAPLELVASHGQAFVNLVGGFVEVHRGTLADAEHQHPCAGTQEIVSTRLAEI